MQAKKSVKQDVIILAGGFGTRLSGVVKDLPKPMANIQGKPFLHYIFQQLKKYDVRHVVLSTGYKSQQITDYFGSRYQGIHIDYAVEKSPLGTGGGILNAMSYCSSGEVFILNGDTFFDIDLRQFLQLHSGHRAAMSIALRRMDDCSRYGFVRRDETDRIVLFGEKKEGMKDCLINGGSYLIDRRQLQSLPLPPKFSMEKDVFERYVGQLPIYGFAFDAYFIDIGIPSDYKRAQDELPRLNY